MTTKDASALAPRVTAEYLRDLEARVNAGGGGRLGVVAPFTGEEIGSVPLGTDDDVRRAVDCAREAQRQWSELSFKTRGRILTRFHDLVLESADQAMDLIQLEAGKSRVAAFEEVYDVVGTTRYYINTAERYLGRRRRSVSVPLFTKAYEMRHPHGVVGFIVPWNFPFTLGISDAVAALMAGNGVVIKPDEKTPYSTLMAVRLLEKAGIPQGLVQVVTGSGGDIGPTLIDEVDFVMFTGSTEVGRQVAQRAASRLIGSSMELGGKNAAIVMDDADLDLAVPGISRAVFANGGQLCIAAERIYVSQSRRAEFTDRFVEHVSKISMTSAYDFSSDMSSIITPEHLGNIDLHVQDAIARGAKLLVGGKPRPDVGPWFYEPTVLTDVDEAMDLCRTETFGPVVSIYGFTDTDEAISLANDSHMGLNFSVWTRDARKGVEIAERLEAGTVGVNDGYAATWSTYDAPMGGHKQSGLSRRHGVEGILKYTEAQTIAVQRGIPAFAPPHGLTYDQYQTVLGKALKLLRRLPFYK